MKAIEAMEAMSMMTMQGNPTKKTTKKMLHQPTVQPLFHKFLRITTIEREQMPLKKPPLCLMPATIKTTRNH